MANNSAPKKTVLHLVDHLNENCGMSSSTLNMIPPLRKQGFEGALLSGPGTAFGRAEAANIPITEIATFSKSKKPTNLISVANQINKYIKNHPVDIIHAHHRLLGLIGWAVGRWQGIPVIHTDHNVLYGNRRTSYWGDGVITVTGQKNHPHNYFHIPNEKVTQCFEFTKIDHLLDHPIAEPRKAGDINQFGQLARLAPQKGQDILLEAVARFNRHSNHPMQLSIKGDGPLKEPLRAMAADLAITDAFHIVRPDDHIAAYFDTLDCFILTSVHEGSCLALVEAAAYGVPIIATKVGAIPDYLDDESAILIEPHSVDAVVDAIEKLHSRSPEQLQSMVVNARQSISTLFNLDRQAQVVAEAYHRILA